MIIERPVQLQNVDTDCVFAFCTNEGEVAMVYSPLRFLPPCLQGRPRCECRTYVLASKMKQISTYN